MATELYATFGNELALTLTPAGSGRFEVYLNDRKIWDRKEAPGRPYPSLAVAHDVRDAVAEAIAAVPVEATD
jgi:predicted Rdx family selenoprotein